MDFLNQHGAIIDLKSKSITLSEDKAIPPESPHSHHTLSVLEDQEFKHINKGMTIAYIEEILDTRGGPAKCHVSAQSEQVMVVASHISTRAGNATDSDGGIDLPPVASLPVIRLLQPMVDGPGDAECHYSAYIHAVQPVAQPADASNTAAAGCISATVASGAAAGSTTAEAVATGEPARAPRGRMALLEKSVADENDFRAALLREEHELHLKLMREEHKSTLDERHEKKILDIQKKKLELEILEIEKQIKLEQLRRLREAPE
ncbi:uncharacterized protein LOC144127661 [Amblyomma americanum]